MESHHTQQVLAAAYTMYTAAFNMEEVLQEGRKFGIMLEVTIHIHSFQIGFVILRRSPMKYISSSIPPNYDMEYAEGPHLIAAVYPGLSSESVLIWYCLM